MHELPITESILEISLRHAEQANSRRVLSIYLVVGQMASIIDDSVQFYWGMIAKGTIAEGAELKFRRIPVKLQCQACGLQYSPGKDDFICPDCGNSEIRIISGQEFYLEAIDIE
jgi:hydrogenase nickel incorporation protein HypA/HybF